MIQRPENNEYKSYFQRYVDLVQEGHFEDIFKQNTEEMIAVFSHIPSDLHTYRYAEGKWTIKDMLMHIIDTERVFSYRMLVAARHDIETQLYSMNENFYAANMHTETRSMESLIEEFKAVRKSTEMLLLNLSDEQSRFLANAMSYQVSARALGYITVGHAMHHMNILKERYLSQEQ